MTDVIALQPQYWIVPAIGLFFVLLGFLFFFAIHALLADEHSYYMSGFRLTAIVLWVIGGIMAIAYAFMLMPYNSKYYVYFKLSGTVESVSNTFDNGSGKMTSRPVVKLSGYDNPIQFSNPRITTLEGKEVDLICSYDWVWEGLDVTHCEIRTIK